MSLPVNRTPRLGNSPTGRTGIYTISAHVGPVAPEVLADACLDSAGFSQMGAPSERDDDLGAASRPFDAGRDEIDHVNAHGTSTPLNDVDRDLDVVSKTGRQTEIRAAVSNSFGFGGQNAVLLITCP